MGTSLDFGTVLSSDSTEAARPAGAGEGRQLPRGASSPGLGPDPGWRARLGAQEGEWGLRAPAERLAWVGEPLHHWPRRYDRGISQRKMWGAGERGCLHLLAAALGPRSRDSHCPGLGWFPPAAHTWCLAHSSGALVSAAGATMPAPGRKAQPGRVSPAARVPRSMVGGTAQLGAALLPQASSTS